MNNTIKRAITALVALCTILGIGFFSRPAVPEVFVTETLPAEQTTIVPEIVELPFVEEAVPEIQEVIEQEEIPHTLFEKLSAEANYALAEQKKVDEALEAELVSHSYTFDEPLVVINPYGNSPLTALVLFETEEPVWVSARVPGKAEIDDVTFQFSVYKTQHIIPIYGLRADMLNVVELTSSVKSGEESKILLELVTEPLPELISDISVITNLQHSELYQDGLNFCFERKQAYDSSGEIRWCLNDFSFTSSQLVNHNGHFLFAKGSYYRGALVIYEMDLLGRIYNVYYSPYGVHHDIYVLENGNILVTGSDSGTPETLIIEIDATTGELVHILNLGDILPRARTTSPLFSEEDWLHLNSIVSDGKGNLLVSSRNQSAVVKLSWPKGEIDWIQSFHDGWPEMYKQYLLNPVGNNFEWQLCQHNPTILPDYDNNSDTIDILLFDNGNDRFSLDKGLQLKIQNGEVVSPELYSRMVHYRINERTRKIEQIWQFGKELGEAYFSRQRGNAMLLPTGSLFATFTKETRLKREDGVFTQVNTNSCIEVSRNGEIIWESYVSHKKSAYDYVEYRTVRAPIYTDRDNDYSFDMVPGNFIPEKEADQ
jgi:Arylsulfotransferase (ASST).